ncbi:MAG: MarR family transcriptional regulator [Acidobacteria bacterium]|nr:MarR family transcriptional regulator [Acidobacteriota bacterium]
MVELSQEEYWALAEFRYRLRTFLRFSEDAARALGLEPSQHQLLLAAKVLRDPTIGTLAERLHLRHHSVVGLVDRLVERGLVVRQRAESDRRQVRVFLTPQGEQILLQLSLHHRDELRRTGPNLVAALQAVLQGGQ